jgi:hypothetical protein
VPAGRTAGKDLDDPGGEADQHADPSGAVISKISPPPQAPSDDPARCMTKEMPSKLAMPGAPAQVQNVIGAILGGIIRPPQPAMPAGYWYWCDASGQYYPNIATCASGWRPVNPR